MNEAKITCHWCCFFVMVALYLYLHFCLCICVLKRTTNHLPLVLLLLFGSLVACFDPLLAPLSCTCWRLVIEQFVFCHFSTFLFTFFLPNFNFYLFSCTCLRQLAHEPHFSVRRQFSQTLHLANISDQSCQLTFEITSKTNTKHFIAIANMLQSHFSRVLSSEPKKKPTRNKKPTRKDSHNSINIWTTFHLVVSILGLRTNISSWGINFKTIKGKVNMQKNAKPEKEQSWCSPLNGWLSTPLLLWSQEIIPQMPKNAKKGLIRI